jgi:hypothetical protein
MNKPNLIARWDDGRAERWLPIERSDAARMLRGNRGKSDRRVYRKGCESRIAGLGVCFVIAKATA